MPIYLKTDNGFRSVISNFLKTSDGWRLITAAYIKTSDGWRQLFSGSVATGKPVGSGTPTIARESNTSYNWSISNNGTWTQYPTSYQYQWQQSSNNSTWSDITGATTISYNMSSFATKYIRCKVWATNDYGQSDTFLTSASSQNYYIPPTPTLVATGGQGQISITPSWSGGDPNATGSVVVNGSTTYSNVSNGVSFIHTISASTNNYVTLTVTNSAAGNYVTATASQTGITVTAPPKAPNTPTGLTVNSNVAGQLTSSWSASSIDSTHDAASYYEISRSQNLYTDPQTLPTYLATNITTTSYTDSGLASSTTWYYYVRAYNAGGYSLWSSGVSGMTKGVPVNGTVSLTATNNARSGSVLTASTSGWIGNPSPTSYYVAIDASTTSDFVTRVIKATNSPSTSTSVTYTVTTSDAATPPYKFRARAFATNTSGDSSEVFSSIIEMLVPLQPTISFSNVTSSGFTVSYPATNADTYYIDIYNYPGGTKASISGYPLTNTSQSSQIITGRSASTTYYVDVYGKNAAGNGPQASSSQATSAVTPPPVTPPPVTPPPVTPPPVTPPPVTPPPVTPPPTGGNRCTTQDKAAGYCPTVGCCSLDGSGLSCSPRNC